jgi:hypothetical protein
MMQAGIRAMQEPITQIEEQAASAPPHPEEIRASMDLRIGSSVSLKATVRTTPAGLVTAGVMVAAIVLSIAGLVAGSTAARSAKGAIHRGRRFAHLKLQASPSAPFSAGPSTLSLHRRSASE